MHKNIPYFEQVIILAGCIITILSSCTAPATPGYTSTGTKDGSTEIIQTPSTPTLIPEISNATQDTLVLPGDPHGLFYLSLDENGFSHLFAYSPQYLPLTRMTSGAWDDTAPSLNSNQSLMAFASHKNGFWDIYVMELESGAISRLTDTPQYDSAPTWSPDGAFLAYESYQDGNLEILIQSATDPNQDALRLTQDPAADYSPSWSPLGRKIAFVSNRTGEPEIWIADLDQSGLNVNISNTPGMLDAHPTWSPDGKVLAWAGTDTSTGMSNIFTWNSQDFLVNQVFAGDWPIWLDNNTLAARLTEPNKSFLTAYTTTGLLLLPPTLLPGTISGLSYGMSSLDYPSIYHASALFTPEPLYIEIPNPPIVIPTDRIPLEDLKDVTAPYPQISSLAFASYETLRDQVHARTGWDALSQLENAFTPLTAPLDPGLGDDWLFTGRAFALNPALIQAGWMLVAREDYGQRTYWRIFLRTKYQDGSQGKPLTQAPWDFSARATSSSAYENGGELSKIIPIGYWFDLTSYASLFGWERIPALANWRSYFSGARFNELIYPQGLDWKTAMLQLYPLEVLITPTQVIPPTRTPTRTPLYYRSPTSTRTPTFFPTSTP